MYVFIPPIICTCFIPSSQVHVPALEALAWRLFKLHKARLTPGMSLTPLIGRPFSFPHHPPFGCKRTFRLHDQRVNAEK